LREWHQAGIVAHVGVRQQGWLVAACLAARNVLRPSTAANCYVYVPGEQSLELLLARVVRGCTDAGVDNIIADLVNKRRQYESVHQELGFRKVAERARCERDLWTRGRRDSLHSPTEEQMADKGSKDKGGREDKKKPKLDPKEKRKLKREKKSGS
jgi:hypothetical protein